MKPRSAVFVLAVVAALLAAASDPCQTSRATNKSGSVLPSAIPQTGTAVLSVANGFVTQPGAVNPLVGRTLVLLKESFDGFLRRKGMFAGPPGSTGAVPPLFAWSVACRTSNPVCQQALYEMQGAIVTEVKMDASGKVSFAGVQPGTYYLFATTAYNGQHLLWDLRVDLKPGANAVTLDQRNTTPVDADQARANAPAGANQSVNSRPCHVADAPKAVRTGIPANSTLSVIGTGYVYTYTKTDRRSGAVVDSFTERGNFSNTTLYLLDEDADTILQSAGLQPGLLGSRLATLTLFDAGTQVENAPGMDLLASILGHPEALEEFSKEAKADFECAMKAIRAHSVAEMTTDANASGAFPNLPAGRYYLFGRFYRITKPVRAGGLLWNLSVSVKPGQNVLKLSVDEAALK